jgi:hypothetical protein
MANRTSPLEQRADGQIGILSVSLFAVGLGGVIAALSAAGRNEWIGVGVCLLAAAHAFGQILTAFLRQ